MVALVTRWVDRPSLGATSVVKGRALVANFQSSRAAQAEVNELVNLLENAHDLPGRPEITIPCLEADLEAYHVLTGLLFEGSTDSLTVDKALARGRDLGHGLLEERSQLERRSKKLRTQLPMIKARHVEGYVDFTQVHMIIEEVEQAGLRDAPGK